MDKVGLGLPILKFVLSAVCYSLVCYYSELNDIVMFSSNSVRIQFLEQHAMVTACVAFTFIIEPALLAAAKTTPEHLAKTYLGQKFAFAGFVFYVIAGSFILSNTHSFPSWAGQHLTPYYATGALFIITGVVNLIYLIYERRRQMKSRN